MRFVQFHAKPCVKQWPSHPYWSGRAMILAWLPSRQRSALVSAQKPPDYPRTSFLYAMRCGWSASAPFRRLRSSMYPW